MSAIIEDGSEDPRSFLEYIVYSQAWYAKTNGMRPGVSEEISVGVPSMDGGTSGSFAIVLHTGIDMQIEMFADAWWILLRYPDLFRKLAELAIGPAKQRKLGRREPITVDEVLAVLKSEGFVDGTPRTDPYRTVRPKTCNYCGAEAKS